MKEKAERHLPMRTCIATGEKRSKSELIRLVYDIDTNKIVVDLRGKQKGRGANILPNIESLELALKKNAIPRALKMKRKLTQEEIQNLKEEFLTKLEEKEFRPNNKPVRIKVKVEN